MINTKNIHPIQCEDLIRIGKENDGGYVIPNKIINLSNILLSYGINKDWSFEKDFRKKNPTIKIECYDHTINLSTLILFTIKSILLSVIHIILSTNPASLSRKRIKKNIFGIFIIPNYYFFFKQNIKHHRNRIWNNNNENSKTIQETIASVEGLKKNIFIKMDIEEAEYLVFDDILNSEENITGIAVEFHNLDKYSNQFNEIINKSKKDFNIVHVHGNNYSKLLPNQNFPSTIEITFLNKKLSKTTELSSKLYPIKGLDQPNKISKSDYKLNF
jgi:hypothetical protein